MTKLSAYYQLYYYVPKSHLETTKKAIFAAGAGKIDGYTNCAWVTKGTGQFKPNKSSKPFIGIPGIINKIIEYKVETICPSTKIKKVVTALKNSHPYESPVFGIITTLDLSVIP